MKEDVMDTVRRLGHGLVDAAQNRLRLLQAELADELDRLGGMLGRLILLALSGLLSIHLLAMVVLAASWDTPWRIPAAVVLCLFAAGGTAMCYRSYLAFKDRPKPLFESSLKELEKDRQLLERVL
ncbi:MAG: phage holin family protein [Panacagrimonas sp.]